MPGHRLDVSRGRDGGASRRSGEKSQDLSMRIGADEGRVGWPEDSAPSHPARVSGANVNG
jgi:hypothetical protein